MLRFGDCKPIHSSMRAFRLGSLAPFESSMDFRLSVFQEQNRRSSPRRPSQNMIDEREVLGVVGKEAQGD